MRPLVSILRSLRRLPALSPLLTLVLRAQPAGAHNPAVALSPTTLAPGAPLTVAASAWFLGPLLLAAGIAFVALSRLRRL